MPINKFQHWFIYAHVRQYLRKFRNTNSTKHKIYTTELEIAFLRWRRFQAGPITTRYTFYRTRISRCCCPTYSQHGQQLWWLDFWFRLSLLFNLRIKPLIVAKDNVWTTSIKYVETLLLKCRYSPDEDVRDFIFIDSGIWAKCF